MSGADSADRAFGSDDEEPPFPVIALISLITGILAAIGHACCCIPYVGMLGMLAYPLTALVLIVSVVTGVVGIVQARGNGSTPGLALSIVGLVCDGVALAIVAMYLAMFGLTGMVMVLAAIFGN